MNTSLIINLAYEPFGFGLYCNDDVIMEYSQKSSRKFSETLVDKIKYHCEKNNIKFSDFSYLGIVNGPGSYTGLRIGISVIKTIAMAVSIPIYSCTSLEAIASQASVLNTTYAVVLPSKKGSMYFQLFSKQSPTKYQTLSDPICVSSDEFFNLISKFNTGVCIFGVLESDVESELIKQPGVSFFKTSLKCEPIMRIVSQKFNDNLDSEFKIIKPFYFHEPNVGTIKRNISRFKNKV